MNNVTTVEDVFKRDVKFFYDHAGFSYDPKNETKEQGRQRCAEILALAESKFRNIEDAYFEWDFDPVTDSTEFDSKNPPRRLYICKIIPDGPNLGGIDLDSDAGLGDPYTRVIEAELAAEYLDQIDG